MRPGSAWPILALAPVHLGIVFLANLEPGFLMPPVGVLLITYIPAMTTTLPRVRDHEARRLRAGRHPLTFAR